MGKASRGLEAFFACACGECASKLSAIADGGMGVWGYGGTVK